MSDREEITWQEAAARLRKTRRDLVAVIRDARPLARRPRARFYLEGNVVVTEVTDF